MMENRLNSEGYITQYLISGLKEEAFIDHTSDENQLRYEKYLRSIVSDTYVNEPEQDIKLNGVSVLGTPWKYYYNYGNWFVDLSTFYSTLTKVEMDASTQLKVDEDMEIRIAVWSYASIDMWCEGEHVCMMNPPVYKPIKKQTVVLKLKKGINRLYMRLQTLGVRDTRILFGIQILDRMEDIRVVLPDGEHTDDVLACAKWLDQLTIKDKQLVGNGPAPQGTMLGYDSLSPDFAKCTTKIERHDISGQEVVVLEKERPYIIVECMVGDQILSRRMEDTAQILPVVLNNIDFEENKKKIYHRIADVESLSRGGKFGFSISNILARKATGRTTERDRELLLETLDQIEQRFDCSDFLVCGLIRYLKNYELDEELKRRVKDVLLHYRYWMDQEGSDAMCFWSENHSLMFYVSAMNAGELYPDEYFTRAHMTGKELWESGKKRVEQWLDDVEKHGFEEFLSTVYMCVTFAGLLNVIDYTPKEISDRATKVTDRLLEMLALHTYKGSVIAPMGRVYRQIIYPFLQGAQALMNLIDPSVPYSYGEGWLAFYATSRYKIPEGLKQLMKCNIEKEYETGNALIRLKKNEAYCITSVQSPREDKAYKRWDNLTLLEEKQKIDKTFHEYTKSLNERFHGTTCFEPGVYGYQQHMWSCALDSETQVFANHPGGTCDSSQMRPGYWYGNGVMPAVSQEKGILGAVYQIPEEHPIHFIHIYWPSVKFDYSQVEKNWLFGKKGTGYMGVWCSAELELHQDQVFDCEYRSYGDEIAYCVFCSQENEYETIEEFVKNCKDRQPIYEHNELRTGDFVIKYQKYEDETQYI